MNRIRTTCALSLESTSSGAPTDILIFPLAPAYTNDGRGPFTYDPAGIISAFKAAGGPVVLDYDHQFDDGQVRSGPVPAAGSYVDMYYDPMAGMRAKVEWTPDAAALLQDKAYRYFSPAFSVIPDAGGDGSSGEVVEIFGGSPVNRPAFGSQMQIASTQNPGSYTSETTPEETGIMKELLKALGLNEDATEADALAALAGIQAVAAVATEVATEVAAETPTAAAIVTAASRKFATDLAGYVAKADHDAAVTELAALKAKNAADAVNALIAACESSGVVLTADQRAAYQKIGLGDKATLETVLAALKPTLSLGEVKDPTAKPGADDKTCGLTAAQQTEAKKAGVSFKAYAAALAKSKTK